MIIHRCDLCKFITDDKTRFNKHLLTLKHKKMQTKSTPDVIIKENDDKFVCKDCNTVCSYRQSFERHIKKNCKMRQTENTTISHSYNTNSNNTNNTVNNITLNNYSDRDDFILTDKDFLKCLKKRGNCMIELIKAQYLNDKYPENKIIRVTNKKLDSVEVFDKNKWSLKDKKQTFNFMDSMLQESEMLTDDWVETNKEKYPEAPEHLRIFYKVKETRKVKDYVREVALEFYNNR